MAFLFGHEPIDHGDARELQLRMRELACLEAIPDVGTRADQARRRRVAGEGEEDRLEVLPGMAHAEVQRDHTVLGEPDAPAGLRSRGRLGLAPGRRGRECAPRPWQQRPPEPRGRLVARRHPHEPSGPTPAALSGRGEARGDTTVHQAVGRSRAVVLVEHPARPSRCEQRELDRRHTRQHDGHGAFAAVEPSQPMPERGDQHGLTHRVHHPDDRLAPPLAEGPPGHASDLQPDPSRGPMAAGHAIGGGGAGHALTVALEQPTVPRQHADVVPVGGERPSQLRDPGRVVSVRDVRQLLEEEHGRSRGHERVAQAASTAAASSAAMDSARSVVVASTMTRTTGSVPDGRTSTRPSSPRSASASRHGRPERVGRVERGPVVDPDVAEDLGQRLHYRGELGQRPVGARHHVDQHETDEGPVPGRRELAEDDVAGLLPSQDQAPLLERVQHVAVTDRGLDELDAAAGQRTPQSEVRHHRGDDGRTRERVPVLEVQRR